MDDWLDVDPDRLTAAERAARLVEFQRLRARLDAEEMRTIGAWDAGMDWAGDGAASGGAWLRGHTGMAGSTAREKVRVARALRLMPLVAAAFAAQEITYAKVRLLAACRTDTNAEAFARDEELLVGFARRFSTDDLEKILNHWKAHADPDGTGADAAKRWERRGATLSLSTDGVGYLNGVLDPESAAVVKGELDRITHELRETDRKDQRIERAAGGAAGAAPRTWPQLRLDALVEMARRAAAFEIRSTGRSRPEVVVTLDYDTLLARAGGAAELSTGAVLTGEAARRLACDAGIVRAIVAGPSQILDLGRATPDPNTAQRRAVALRWSGCFWLGCDQPVNWTQLHHIDHYRRGHTSGGETNILDLLPGCTHHHHRIHEDGYTVTRDEHGDDITVHRPDGSFLFTVHPDGPITRRPSRVKASRTGPGRAEPPPRTTAVAHR